MLAKQSLHIKVIHVRSIFWYLCSLHRPLCNLLRVFDRVLVCQAISVPANRATTHCWVDLARLDVGRREDLVERFRKRLVHRHYDLGLGQTTILLKLILLIRLKFFVILLQL